MSNGDRPGHTTSRTVAAQSAGLALRALTSLPEAVALAAIRAAADALPAATVRVDDEVPGRLRMALLDPGAAAEQCRFVAEVSSDMQLRSVRVGGMDRYRLARARRWRLIPVGPPRVVGIDDYRRLLEAIAAELTAADPGTLVAITEPAPTAATWSGRGGDQGRRGVA